MTPKKGSVGSQKLTGNPMLNPHEPLEEMRLAERNRDKHFRKSPKL